MKHDFNDGAGPRGYLNQLVQRMGGLDPAALPVVERCKYVQHLRNHILQAAAETRRKSRGEVSRVDEALFKKEIDLLNAWNAHLDYSPALKKWLDDGRGVYIRDLRRHLPMDKLKSLWRAQDYEGRARLVQDVQKRQCSVYAQGAIDFFPSRISHFRSADLGGFVISDPQRLNINEIPDLHVNTSHFKDDDPSLALSTAHHEQIHLFLLQLAMAARRDMIPAAHPLYGDAVLQRHKNELRTYVSGVLPSGYLGDPEEQLCSAQQQAFENDFICAAPAPRTGWAQIPWLRYIFT